MRVRWPFVAALVATVVGTGAYAATPYVKSEWQERQDARAERLAQAEFRKAQPAADALGRMARPPAIGTCDGVAEDSVVSTHYVCWSGDGEIEQTAVAIGTELRRIGAERVEPRCRRKPNAPIDHPLRVTCGLTATLEGAAVSFVVGPELEKDGRSFRPDGVWVSGSVWSAGLDLDLDPIGPSATPLPLPQD